MPMHQDPLLVCIFGTHWKATGATRALGCHWNHTGWCYHPVVSQLQSSVNWHNWNTVDDHWKATGRPLDAHWNHTGYQQFCLQWHSILHWGLNFRHTGCHWIATELQLAQGKGVYQWFQDLSHVLVPPCGDNVNQYHTHLLLIFLLGQGTSSKTEPSFQIWHSHSGTAHLPSKTSSLLQ